MDINSIFKYGSTGDVLIRSTAAQHIDGIDLRPQEPFTLIKDINIVFNYGQNNKEITKQGTLLFDNNNYPSSITLQNVPITQKISKLIFKPQNINFLQKTNYIKATSINHEIYLPHDAIYHAFVYDSKNELIGTVECGDNVILSPDLIDGETYTVFYEYRLEAPSTAYSLGTPDFGYFTLEIFGVGNRNSQDSTVYIKLMQCALQTNKSLYFDNSGSNTVNLTFKIIADNPDYLVFE